MQNNDDILEIKAITQVEAMFQTKATQMPQELKNVVEQLSPMQKRYAEYRSKGLKQSDAAKKAGSTAKDRAAQGRVGYNWEQLEGMKEYIAFLYEKRAQAAMLDEIEILESLRKTLDKAMELDRMDWANKTIELMGNMIGAFNKSITKEVKTKHASKGNEAFKNEGEEVSKDQRLKDIQSLMNSIQRTKVYTEGSKQ